MKKKIKILKTDKINTLTKTNKMYIIKKNKIGEVNDSKVLEKNRINNISNLLSI